MTPEILSSLIGTPPEIRYVLTPEILTRSWNLGFRLEDWEVRPTDRALQRVALRADLIGPCAETCRLVWRAWPPGWTFEITSHGKRDLPRAWGSVSRVLHVAEVYVRAALASGWSPETSWLAP